MLSLLAYAPGGVLAFAPKPAFGDAVAAPRQDVVATKLLLLHPLPLDGSIFSDGIRALGDACVAPTLYGAGDHISAWAEAALDSVGDGPIAVVGNSIGGSCAIEIASQPSPPRPLPLAT